MSHTYEQYRAMLPTHKHRLDDELELQAQVMEEISLEVTRKNSRQIDLKEEVARLDGRLAEDVREDDPKATIGSIDAKIKRNPERVKAWEVYQVARAEHEKWSGLLDAWKQKGYSIKTLADLYAASYFTLASHQARSRNPGRPENDPDAQDSIRVRMREEANKRGSASEPEQTTSRRRSIL